MKFRSLRADEIDVRVATVTENGCSLLLYKDARCDMNILDETVGELNWQREHLRDNANCKVSIWDGDKKQWIAKEDTGTESYTEKEKGLASDSFKRACFNWGIGRELYTAPFIWVTGYSKKDSRDKWTVRERFQAKSLEVVNGKITQLTIIDSKGKIAFNYGGYPKQEDKVAPQQSEEEQRKKAINCILKIVGDRDDILYNILTEYKLEGLDKATQDQLKEIYDKVKKELKK